MTPPMVSLLIPMRNEAARIATCISSILAQDYPPERLEALIIDGQSSDDSVTIAEDLLGLRPHWRIIPNSRITQAAGWNLGIAQAIGEIIGIVSAHAVLAPDYVSKAVSTLERTNADLVGGPMRAVGETPLAKAIAQATSSPFGVGGARFHYADREADVDTVYMGLCRRSVFARIGVFDEEMVRDQDDELSYRLRKYGGRIVCNPAIRSEYYCRSTLSSLARQYYEYGYWKVRVFQKHPNQMQLRHFMPPTLVGTIALLAALMPISRRARLAFGGLITIYSVVDLVASALTMRRSRWQTLHVLPAVYAILHGCYGAGFLHGLLRFRRQWLCK